MYILFDLKKEFRLIKQLVLQLLKITTFIKVSLYTTMVLVFKSSLSHLILCGIGHILSSCN